MSGQHCESYDVKWETVHCYPVNSSLLTAVARDGWNLSAVFKFCFCFVLRYNKSLNDWSLGAQWILFPSNLNVSLNFVSGNIEILGKQNSLFPSGPVIKCLLFRMAVWNGPTGHMFQLDMFSLINIDLRISTTYSTLPVKLIPAKWGDFVMLSPNVFPEDGIKFTTPRQQKQQLEI